MCPLAPGLLPYNPAFERKRSTNNLRLRTQSRGDPSSATQGYMASVRNAVQIKLRGVCYWTNIHIATPIYICALQRVTGRYMWTGLIVLSRYILLSTVATTLSVFLYVPKSMLAAQGLLVNIGDPLPATLDVRQVYRALCCYYENPPLRLHLIS
ncbi:hypothetical protein F4779DRAFT_579498 [Xylariaceae sp. FL0662B]|nr:hypothetical protein F4779DRAFT_579498 [Xylariaceae sp. FL0662B]